MRWDLIPYYLKRLTSMTPRGALVRLNHAIRHRREQRLYANDPEAYSLGRLWEDRAEWLTDRHVHSASVTLEETFARHVPPNWWQDADFWTEFASFYPDAADLIIKRADEIVAGRITLFGWQQIDFQSSIMWSSHLSGKAPSQEWPQKHYAFLKFFHDPADPERDVKWCWELSRFQHLLLLGAAWKLTSDERYPIAAREHIEDWMAAVRYPLGIQWSSNLEAALRMLSFMRCHVLCSASRAWNEEFLQRFLPCLYLHCFHVENELTVHHAPGNHLLGEAVALVMLGLLYTCFAAADRWVRKGLRILETLVPRLILPDGVYAEQSTGYFRFVAEFLLPLIHLANASGTPVPAVLRQRVAVGLQFIDAISPDLRQVPMIGDADSGHAIGWGLGDYWDFTSLAAAGSVLCDADIPTERIGRFPAEAFLMLGSRGHEAFCRIYQLPQRSVCSRHSCESSPAARGIGPRFRGDDSVERSPLTMPASAAGGRPVTHHFSDGGYQMSRDALFHIIFDVGPLGMPPRYGHGHADGLSLIVSYRGKPVMVDVGTFVYNGSPQWREYFRSTVAHNTVAVDRGSQSRPLDTFLWDRDLVMSAGPPRSSARWSLLHGCIRWRAAVHHRYVLHLVEQAVVVIDRVEGEGSHLMQLSTHWHPQVRMHRMGECRLTGMTGAGDLDVFLSCPDPGSIDVLRGQDHPPAGWYSSRYGHKEPCCTLRGETIALLPSVFLWAMKPKGLEIEVPEDVFGAGPLVDLFHQLRSPDFTSWARES